MPPLSALVDVAVAVVAVCIVGVLLAAAITFNDQLNRASGDSTDRPPMPRKIAMRRR